MTFLMTNLFDCTELTISCNYGTFYIICMLKHVMLKTKLCKCLIVLLNFR